MCLWQTTPCSLAARLRLLLTLAAGTVVPSATQGRQGNHTYGDADHNQDRVRASIIAGFCGNRGALQLGIQVKFTLRPTLLLELPIFFFLGRCHGAQIADRDVQDTVADRAKRKNGGSRHAHVFGKLFYKVFGRELRQNVTLAIRLRSAIFGGQRIGNVGIHSRGGCSWSVGLCHDHGENVSDVHILTDRYL